MLRWAAVGQGRREDVIDAALAAQARFPVAVLGSEFSAGRSLVWMLSRPGDRLLHRHDGAVEGFSSSVAFDQREGTAAVILTNRFSAETPLLSQEMLGVEPRRWFPEIPAGLVESDEDVVGHYRGPLECDAWIFREESGRW